MEWIEINNTKMIKDLSIQNNDLSLVWNRFVPTSLGGG